MDLEWPGATHLSIHLAEPWNQYGSHPPFIVDGQGNFYRCFAANRSHPKGALIGAFLALPDHADEVSGNLGQTGKPSGSRLDRSSGTLSRLPSEGNSGTVRDRASADQR